MYFVRVKKPLIERIHFFKNQLNQVSCVRAYMRVRMCPCVGACVCVRLYACAFACMCVGVGVCAYIHIRSNV